MRQDYIKKLRKRDEELGKKGWGQIATPLLIKTAGGKQNVNCANWDIRNGIKNILKNKERHYRRTKPFG